MIYKPTILICDDDSEILQTLSLSLRSVYDVTTVNTVEKAKRLCDIEKFDIAIVDLNFEGQENDGIHLLDFLNKTTPSTYLVVLSGDTKTKRIIEATRRRLFEFIVKDATYFKNLTLCLNKVQQLILARKEKSNKKYLTKSSVIEETLLKIDAVLRSNSNSPILILGETGTGKECLAQHIAENLGIKSVTANMGSIPTETAESVLFGHERGAFTGAITNKTGLIEAAHNGIFFLDEIGECSSAVQTKLLRAIQEKEVQPLGANKAKKINVRFIAATHRDLNKQVNEGSFRLDLLQRLNTFVFKLPALRERPEDILFYARIFIEELSENGTNFSFTEDGEKELLAYGWPGNIRELRNVIERIVVLSPKLSIDKNIVVEAIEVGRLSQSTFITKAEVVATNAKKDELIKTLNEFKGNKRQSAISLGVSEATLYRWIKEFNLTDKLNQTVFKSKGEIIA